MKMKQLTAGMIALVMSMSLPMTTYAADWDLEKGSITVNADNSGQTVTQQGSTPKQDDAPVITQRDSSAATSNTITINTSDNATANVTIKDINIKSSNDAIDVTGSSSANITLEGDNKIFSETGSALHISDGNVTIKGSGFLKAEIQDDFGSDHNYNAKIGSHENEDMSGSIHITGDATVKTDDNTASDCGGDGAGIGSGENGKMSGNIVIDGNAQVEVSSNDRGAGIGSGDGGHLSGNIMIGGNAQVSATGAENSAGIGTGDDGHFKGSITIDGNAKVTAKAGGDHNGYDGSGIGTGDKGEFTGTVTIGGNAAVVASGSDEGCGIGSSDDKNMNGIIIIRDHAKITAYGGNQGAAIGSEDYGDMTGKIIIVGNAIVNTGVVDDAGNVLSNRIGYIGDGQDSNHDSSKGHYIIGPDVTINGLNGSDTEVLKQYVNMHLDSEKNPTNLTELDIRMENGIFKAKATGAGSVEKILYNGSETVPTVPGSYPVTCIIKIDGSEMELPIGTLVIPEPASPGETAAPAENTVQVPASEPAEQTNESTEYKAPVQAPASEPAEQTNESTEYKAPVQKFLYRVVDKDGKEIVFHTAQKDGVLAIATDSDFAMLTGEMKEIETLMNQGVSRIIFATKGRTSTFLLSDLLEKRAYGETWSLIHDGETVAFIAVEKKMDISSILTRL